ncbi:MAG: hypothetical protein AABX11_01565 [Nanoarchaeota archaeon]
MINKRLPNNALRILADLTKARRPMSIKQIADRNNVYWKTANENIKKLETRKLILCSHGTRRNYCKINPKWKIKI